MKILVFDTETTGLPTERNPCITETSKWPYILQLSYILLDTDSKQIIISRDDLIKIPINVEITPGSEAIHHISKIMCETNGINITEALSYFNTNLLQADRIVGHNISFDKRMIMVECMRNNIKQKFTVNGIRKDEYCTMKKGTDLCKIVKTNLNGETYFKYPTLTELHLKLFGINPIGMHDALIDVLICLRCYMKINFDYGDCIEIDIMKKKLLF